MFSGDYQQKSSFLWLNKFSCSNTCCTYSWSVMHSYRNTSPPIQTLHHYLSLLTHHDLLYTNEWIKFWTIKLSLVKKNQTMVNNPSKKKIYYSAPLGLLPLSFSVLKILFSSFPENLIFHCSQSCMEWQLNMLAFKNLKILRTHGNYCYRWKNMINTKHHTT